MGLQQYSDWCCRCRVRYKTARSAMLLPCKCKVQLFAAAPPQVPFPELSTSGYRRGNLQNQGVSLRPCFVQLVQHGGCLGNPTNARYTKSTGYKRAKSQMHNSPAINARENAHKTQRIAPELELQFTFPNFAACYILLMLR
jgi:hypothetical protein